MRTAEMHAYGRSGATLQKSTQRKATTTGYTYDSSGRKSADTDALPPMGSVVASYTYTETGRLASDTTSGSASYIFDAAGNIATETVGALQRTYQYGAGNRLEHVKVGGSIETTFAFDPANGWRTAQGPLSNPTERVFGYTGTGRLASFATSQGVSATYGYDAAGQRISSEVVEPSVDGTATTETRYVYEGLSLLSLASTRTIEGTSAVDAWEISYLYDGQGRQYAGVYRSEQDAAVPFVMVTTDRGDVVELRDTSGSPFAAYGYDVWGTHRSEACTSVAVGSIDAVTAAEILERQPLRYAGYCFDEHSGLYYLSARTYDPATRQFLSKDPAKADGEESAYQYCGGDPVGRVDPSGMTSLGANDRERDLAKRYPLEAFYVLNAKTEAEALSVFWCEGQSGVSVRMSRLAKLNAMRHGVYAARIMQYLSRVHFSRAMGEQRAYEWLFAHEYGQSGADHLADVYNNRVGVRRGYLNMWADLWDTAALIHAAWKHGEMQDNVEAFYSGTRRSPGDPRAGNPGRYRSNTWTKVA